ncbi:MAG: YkgJ family cysteine cluster protein [Bacteroidota bacterium]
MQKILEELPKRAKDKHNENKKYFQKLRKKKPKQLDLVMQDIHDEVFEYIDCLSCANCCKTTGPLLKDKDIERLSKFMKMKSTAFIDQYLRIDEDNDYVFKEMPCPFLAADNYCLVYEARPKACREYPHLDRKKIFQIGNLTVKNTEICPAVFDGVELLKEKIPLK